jgi:hypothetical protein
MSSEPFAINQEKDPRYNQEPGLILEPGSAIVRETARFEQFPSRFTGGGQPGNPYVYREYPKMLYRAQHHDGKAVCMAAPPDSSLFKDGREFQLAEERARRFTESCQLIVGNPEERQRAMENGWRESPAEAVAYLAGRDRAESNATAHRLYEDRNLSEAAQREVDAVMEASGGEHQPEITARQVKEAKESKRARRA